MGLSKEVLKLCYEIEKLPASELQTRLCNMTSYIYDISLNLFVVIHKCCMRLSSGQAINPHDDLSNLLNELLVEIQPKETPSKNDEYNALNLFYELEKRVETLEMFCAKLIKGE